MRQRAAQAQALLDLHTQACAQALAPPLLDETGGPFQAKPHTRSAVLCGDFNLEATSAEYGLLQAALANGATRFMDAWPLCHGARPQDPTFRLFDRRYGPEPIACDFIFVSEDLVSRVMRVEVNGMSQASDHQPMLLELG